MNGLVRMFSISTLSDHRVAEGMRMFWLSLATYLIGAILSPLSAQGPSVPTHVINIDRTAWRGEYTSLRSAIAISDTSVVVLDLSGPSLALVSRGTTKPLGRPGEGPGEYRMPFAMGRIADSIWLADLSLRRFTIYPLGGGASRTISTTVDPTFSTIRGSVSPMALFGNGNALLTFDASSADTALTRASPLLVGPPTKGPWRQVTTFNRGKAIEVKVGSVYLHPRNPFLVFDYVAVNPNSGNFAVLRNTLVPRNAPGTLVIELFDQNGAATGMRTIQLTGLDIPQSAVKLAIDNEIEMNNRILRQMGRQEDSRTEIQNAMGNQNAFPIFSTVAWASSGRLWIRRSSIPGAPSEWLGVDPRTGSAILAKLNSDCAILDEKGNRMWLRCIEDDAPLLRTATLTPRG